MVTMKVNAQMQMFFSYAFLTLQFSGFAQWRNEFDFERLALCTS